jgi:hypothetical protein
VKENGLAAAMVAFADVEGAQAATSKDELTDADGVLGDSERRMMGRGCRSDWFQGVMSWGCFCGPLGGDLMDSACFGLVAWVPAWGACCRDEDRVGRVWTEGALRLRLAVTIALEFFGELLNGLLYATSFVFAMLACIPPMTERIEFTAHP